MRNGLGGDSTTFSCTPQQVYNKTVHHYITSKYQQRSSSSTIVVYQSRTLITTSFPRIHLSSALRIPCMLERRKTKIYI